MWEVGDMGDSFCNVELVYTNKRVLKHLFQLIISIKPSRLVYFSDKERCIWELFLFTHYERCRVIKITE